MQSIAITREDEREASTGGWGGWVSVPRERNGGLKGLCISNSYIDSCYVVQARNMLQVFQQQNQARQIIPSLSLLQVVGLVWVM